MTNPLKVKDELEVYKVKDRDTIIEVDHRGHPKAGLDSRDLSP